MMQTIAAFLISMAISLGHAFFQVSAGSRMAISPFLNSGSCFKNLTTAQSLMSNCGKFYFSTGERITFGIPARTAARSNYSHVDPSSARSAGIKASQGDANRGLVPKKGAALYDVAQDDTSALVKQADAVAGSSQALLLTRQYRVTSNQTITASLAFEAGGALIPDSGVTLKLTGVVQASDTAWIFRGAGKVIVSNAPRLSVDWWGASPGASDSAPAFIAAGAGRALAATTTIIAPDAGYTFCSATQSIPSYHVRATDPTAVVYSGLSHLHVTSVNGATLTVCPNVSKLPISSIAFDEITGLEFDGFTFVGTKIGIAMAQENNAFGLNRVRNFHIHDITITDGYQGIGSPLGGDWMMDGLIERLKAKNVGICFDAAFIYNVIVDHVSCTGQGEAGRVGKYVSGQTNPGQKAFSIIYDPPNVAFMPPWWPSSTPDSFNVKVRDSSATNFMTGAAIANGRHVQFLDSNMSAQPGASGLLGLGYFIYGTNDGHWPSDILIAGGQCSNNGAAAGGRCLSFGTPTSTSGNIDGVLITGVTIANNNSIALDAPSSPYITHIRQSKNKFISGSMAQTALSKTFLALLSQPSRRGRPI